MTSELPSTCKAMVAEKAGAALVLKDVPVTPPQAGEVLVKSVASGVCHTDDTIRQGNFGDLFPRILGHEVVGDIVAVGPNVSGFKVGDRVGGGWHGGHDFSCKQCRRGMFQLCDNEVINGITKDGGYAEYVKLRAEATVSIPKEVDPVEAAPILCAGVTTFNGIRNMHIPPGETVAVQGIGGLGHLAIQYARKLGYRTVALSTSDRKKDLAMKLGATDYINTSAQDPGQALQALGGAALIVYTAYNAEVVPSLLSGLSGGGKFLVIPPAGDIPVNTDAIIQKGLSIYGWNTGHSLDVEETLKFGKYSDVHCMTETVPLREANEALHKMHTGEVRFRSVLTF